VKTTGHYDADGNLTGTSKSPSGCSGCLGIGLAMLLILGIIGDAIVHPYMWAVLVPVVALAVWGTWKFPKAGGRHKTP
jgi:hypothetical protein